LRSDTTEERQDIEGSRYAACGMRLCRDPRYLSGDARACSLCQNSSADSPEMLRAGYLRSRAHPSSDGGAESEHASRTEGFGCRQLLAALDFILQTTAHVDGINSVARGFQGLASSATLMAIADFLTQMNSISILRGSYALASYLEACVIASQALNVVID